ncbi:MAG TPA: 3-dehydroquinate synthase [Clostridiales bacterium UBA8960]|jgi:3-dehydroquinate synthase|nr:3-dehydroquinate synthase [Clostridiales bacterium UBA8960]
MTLPNIHLEFGKRKYVVHIDKKICHDHLLREYCDQENLGDVVIITDENLALHYRGLLEGFKSIVVPSGEPSKTLNAYASVLEKMVEFGITRKGLVLAFGGGVIGDLAGFVAATYMRGIRLIQVPTTLLAMVDSSIGGKVAVNLPNGKNLVGTFYQPDVVHINPNFLKTLPKREWSNGIAEVIKYAVGFDASLMDLLENAMEEHLEVMIYKCVKIKADIVMQDEKDEGIRNLLNFGHTLGHAIEHYYDYARFLHGEAVAIGIAAKTRIAFQEQLISAVELSRVLNLLRKYDLPTSLEAHSLHAVLSGIKHDKKAASDKAIWIGLKSLGELEVRTCSSEEAIELFSGGLRDKQDL